MSELTSRRNASLTSQTDIKLDWNQVESPIHLKALWLPHTLPLITAMAPSGCLNARSLVTAATVAFVTISRTPCEVDAEQQLSSPVAPQVCHIVDFQSALTFVMTCHLIAFLIMHRKGTRTQSCRAHTLHFLFTSTGTDQHSHLLIVV